MTVIVDRPEDFATSALRGYCALHPDRLRLVSGGVVRATATPPGKVAVVVGGGSGHFPAFAGYVGPGLADAAVAGDVFASPSTHAIAHVARLANRDGGVVLGFGNYAGDVLNFGLAAERLRIQGIETCVLAVTDDVASAPAEQSSLRRGVAGDLVVFKIAGAAAEAGLPLAEVERLARHCNARTISFGVAFSGCTLPGRHEPLFTVPRGRMALGLGIHGEPGVSEQALGSAEELAGVLVGRLLDEPRPKEAERVAVMLNGLGATKWEELFVLWTHVEAKLKAAGLVLVDPIAGELVTSLDMAGCSLTLTWLDDALEPLWRAPAETSVLQRGALAATAAAPPFEEAVDTAAAIPPATADSQAAARRIAALLQSLAAVMHESEAELGRLDAVAGDGDHGQGMARGSAAASLAASEAAAAGAGAATLLARAGDAWADRAGGTSGALWGLALRSWSAAFSDDMAPTPHAAVAGADAALAAVVRLGGATLGDKTLVDALVPFVDTLRHRVTAGEDFPFAWQRAAEAAERAAAATADLTPRLGRARPLAARSVGSPDPGAISLARCVTVIGRELEAAATEQQS